MIKAITMLIAFSQNSLRITHLSHSHPTNGDGRQRCEQSAVSGG